MRLKTIMESAQKARVGVIPAYYDGQEWKYLFMIPSNPNYGGTEPQIAKGRQEDGEDPKTSALREGNEELGLVDGNIERVLGPVSNTITGLDHTYEMLVWVVVVKSMENFTKPHYETGSTHWLSEEEIKVKVRSSQRALVMKTIKIIA